MAKKVANSNLSKAKSKLDDAIKAHSKVAKERGLIQQKLFKANEKVEEAEAKADKANREYLSVRTETFDPVLVSKARDMGVNPDNFETEKELSVALKPAAQTLQEPEDDGGS